MLVHRLSLLSVSSLLIFSAVLFPVRAAAFEQTIEHAYLPDASQLDVREVDGTRQLVWSGADHLRVEGAPVLPRESQRFVVPTGMKLTGAELVDPRWESLGKIELPVAAATVSSDGEAASIVDSFGLLEATSDRPAKNVVVGGTEVLHGYTIASVDLLPVRITADGVVERLTSARIALSLELSTDATDRTRRRVDWPGVRERDAKDVASLVSNPQDVDGFAPPRGVSPQIASKAPLRPQARERMDRSFDYAVDYIIVSPTQYVAEFQTLADYRMLEGIRTEVVTVADILAVAHPGEDLQSTIRNYLREAYSDWGLQYVLLAGDAELLPPRYVRDYFYPTGSYTDIPTDHYFACLDGSWNDDGDGLYGESFTGLSIPGDLVDMLAELSIGRAPVGTLTEAQNFVAKTIEYADPTNPGYVAAALFLSEVLFPASWNGVDPVILDGADYSEDIVFNSIIGGGNLMQSWRMYENYTAHAGAIPETKAAAMDSLQTGHFGLVNHIGHGFYYNMSVGDANIFVSDVELLTNPNPFIVHALNCSSGAFDFDCLLERFVQIDAGAAASIGSSRAAFPQSADLYQQRFYWEVFVNGTFRIGDAARLSKSYYSGNTLALGTHRWTHFTYHLFGDPTLSMWRQAPTTPALSYSSSVPVGIQTLVVGVTATGGAENAWVGATRADGGFAAAQVNVLGQATLDLSGLTDRPGTITLTVAGANLARTTGVVTVTAPGTAHVRAAANSVTDDGSGSTTGDSDGVADSGEIVEWNFDFENNGGGATAFGVSAQLSIVDAPGVTVVQDSIYVGDIADAVSVAGPTGFVLDLANTIPDASLMRFDVVITDGSDTWTQPATLVTKAPEIEVARVRIDDSVAGNGNGVSEVGETVDVYVELVNYGGAEARGLSATLSSASPNVSIVTAAASWADLSTVTTADPVAPLQIIESDVVTENWMTLTITDSEGHTWLHDFELRPEAAPGLPELITSLGPDRIGVRMPDPSPANHFFGYRVYRRPASGGSFAEITFDRTVRTGFIEDSGLALLTRYEYQVTLVDSSAVESDPSAIVSASTAPPELAPFYPIPLGMELAGPNAVGDVRGDGSRVLAFGADWIYALDALGQELLDGDGDSQTLGPIAGDPSNLRFTPSGVTLADLDGDGADEIIAANWLNLKIYVVRADGTDFPGWPQLMNNKSWATPAVGDLDNDGDLEIVVTNIAGRTYVWNHDGTDFYDGDANPATVGVFHVRPGETWNRCSPALFDVDGDGTLEILFGTFWRDGVTDNMVYALKNDATNAVGWPQNTGINGYSVGHVTVGDLDNDGIEEIILLTEDNNLNLWQPDGSTVPGSPYFVTSNAASKDSRTPATAIADFDRDGTKEMVVVSTIARDHAEISIMGRDGTVWTGWPRILPGLSESSPIIGDINGDNFPDIVFGVGGGSDGMPNVLYAFNADGTDVDGFPITLGGPVRAVPVIDDFDLDGDVDVLYAGFDLQAHVWDMPFAYNPSLVPWPTFQQNNHRTGVYADDRITGVLTAEVSVAPTVGGVRIESFFFGAIAPELRFSLERREFSVGEFRVIASDLKIDAGSVLYVDRTAESGRTYEYRLVDAQGAYEFRSGSVEVPLLRAALHEAFPNPFNPSTEIRFEVPGVAGDQVPVRLEIYDVAGRRVTQLHSGPLTPGRHSRTWDGRDGHGAGVSSGVYFAILRCAGQQETIKMSLVK